MSGSSAYTQAVGDADFDALLEPQPSAKARPAASAPGSGSVPAGAGGSGRLEATVVVDSHETPTVREFIQGWDIFGDPVLAGLLAGASLGGLGVFVLLRRAVFITAALSQSAALGVALAYYAEIHLELGVSPTACALLMSGAASLLLGARTARVSRETWVGLVFVGASALAVVVGDRIAQEAHDISSILFGSAVLVRRSDVWVLSAGAVVSLGALWVLFRALTFTGLDPDGARVQGLPVRAIDVAFWALFAVEVSVATRALGSLPVFAFAVLPAAAGIVLSNRLSSAVWIAIGVGSLSGALGYIAAFFSSLPVGATQATVATASVLMAYVVSRLASRIAVR